MEAEELYGRYLMSEFARLSCMENCRKAKENIDKEVTVIMNKILKGRRSWLQIFLFFVPRRPSCGLPYLHFKEI